MDNYFHIKYSKDELLKLQHDEEFQLEQVRKNGSNIKFIDNPSEKVQLEAVKKFIHNQVH